MSKSRTQSKKKRKREKIARSLSPSTSTSNQKLDRRYRNAPESVARSREGNELDERSANKDRRDKKHKKKRTRKNPLGCEGEQIYGKVDDEHNNVGKIDENEPAAKLTSTGQQQQNENSLNDSAMESEMLPKKRKKKKKRKSTKRVGSSSADDHTSGSTIDFHHGSIADDNDEDELALEGSMVSGILVLTNRKTGRVYSATAERLENGERKLAGRLDGKGQVVLFPTTEERTNDSQPFPNSSNENVVDHNSSSDFPYEVDPDDHCESPLEAYKDIVPLLESYRRWIRKQSNVQLSIYDPYFCNGRVARHLESLGFPEVYNRKEDCYNVWKDPSMYPNYDIFLTNPPYSVDHIEKLMQHVTSKQNESKPWMLLMPNFVHKKDYFQQLTTSSGQLPIYLVPKKRYIYQPPPNMREKKASSTHKKSSPFVSMWYLWGGSRKVTDEWYRVLRKQNSAAFDVARSKSALRDLRRKPKKR